MKKLEGRIVNIEKNQNQSVYIKQGVQGSEQYKYDKYSGGNGTYVLGGEYLGSSLDVKIFFDLDKSFTIDVCDDIRKITGKSRISTKMLETIESHKGDKIDAFVDESKVIFDPSILLL
ncbi:MAG TPA: hypothetical protein H9952_06815 [Candidatus Massiliomicrobiota merdigallinarum]|jgi:hypothetical protein|nr:hypothetical protein [Candidatus Massilimicrobiota merdigallinarum]